MPVAEMARYSDLVRADKGNEAERIALMECHARTLERQIEALIACREVICDKIDSYRGALAERDVTLPPATVARTGAPDRDR
jgi:hypothetical protein